MHIGSSSSMPTTCDDAPLAVSMSLNCQNAQGSVVDWVFSRRLEMFPELKLAYAESQVGWMPFQCERMDSVWHEDVGGVRLPEPPSSYVKGRVFGCIFDDLHGLQQPRRGRDGPDPVRVRLPAPERQLPELAGGRPPPDHRRPGSTPTSAYKLLRGNAIHVYGLDRFGITE